LWEQDHQENRHKELIRDPHKKSRKETPSNPMNQKYQEKAPKIHRRKGHEIHKKITKEQEFELQTFHTSCGKILCKEASNLPSSYPLEICISSASLEKEEEKGKQESK
jgi:hypothetical protein